MMVVCSNDAVTVAATFVVEVLVDDVVFGRHEPTGGMEGRQWLMRGACLFVNWLSEWTLVK